MFDNLSPRATIELTEMDSDLGSLLRNVLLASESREAEPTTHGDAQRSLDSYFRAAGPARLAVLDERISARHAAPEARAAILSAVVGVLEEQMSMLESDGDYAAPRELLDGVLDILAADPEPRTFVSRAELEIEVAGTCARFVGVSTRAVDLAHRVLRPEAEVAEGESLALVGMAPGDAQSHFALGEARARQGNLEGALASFQEAYRLDSASPHHAYYTARCLFDLGRAAEALPLAERAVELWKSNSVGWSLLGSVREALGELQAAVDAHLTAAKLSFGGDAIVSDAALQRLSADPELSLPRPPGFRLPEIDQRCEYAGFHGTTANCRIRIFKDGPNAVVVATWDDRSSGTSITNQAEALAELVCRRHAIPREGLTWIEHYERSMDGGHSLSRVEFTLAPGGRFTDPSWRRVTHAEFEALTHYRLSWAPERS